MKNIFISLLALTSLIFNIQAQTTDNGYTIDGIDKNYGKLEIVHSDTMNKDFPVLVFLPENYKKNDKPFKVVYMLHGTNNRPVTEEGIRQLFNPKTKIQETASEFNVIIVTPIVGNTYYLDSPLDSGFRYASYIGIELPKYIDSKYNTLASREGRILSGFSVGGYGSISLICRFPDTFSVALERAGVMSLTTTIDDLYWDDVNTHLTPVLGNYWENAKHWHQNDCLNLINHVRHRDDVSIVMEVGTEDFLYKTNCRFHERLNELNIPHIYAEYPGGHKWSAEALHSLLTHLQYFNKTIED